MRYGSLYFNLENCHNYIEIKDASNCGGLVPSYQDIENSFINITGCSNHGNITSKSGGGICGSYAGYKGNCTITNSYNIGIIGYGYDYAGGICGTYAGNSGHCTITNSYNSGNIINSGFAGGICGQFAGSNKGNCTITNSYNIGNIITSNDVGGICAIFAGKNGNCDISNCFSYINSLTGIYSGSILGSNSSNVKLHNVFSNQKQYFMVGRHISSTYDINGVSKISNSGIGNTDISGTKLQYLITGSESENSFEKVPLFNNNKNYPNNWVFDYDISLNSFSNPFYKKQKNKIGSTDKYFPLLNSDLNLKHIISKMTDNNNNFNFDIRIGDISLNNISNDLKKEILIELSLDNSLYDTCSNIIIQNIKYDNGDGSGDKKYDYKKIFKHDILSNYDKPIQINDHSFIYLNINDKKFLS